MKILPKVAAILHLAFYSCLPHYSMEIPQDLTMTSAPSADETSIIIQAQGKSFSFVQKTDIIRDFKFNRPIRLSGSSDSALPNMNAGRKMRLYFFVNGIHANLPLVQYKIPLSEHTAAG